MKQPSPPPSKLMIRSEVLAVIDFLVTIESPPKHDRVKQVRRLSNIEDQKVVQEILIKELHRATSQRERQAVTELLMELGTVESLHDPLWSIIKNPDTSDEIKDAANLVLHHLGDESDPDLYLDYLEDPQGLINRETERMLEVSAINPEALIDFIDFIFSLPVEEQCNLLASLQTDFQAEYLLNLYIPAYKADPPLEIKELILKNLGQIRFKRSALFLHDLVTEGSEDEELLKIARRSINELRIAGIYREELMEEYRQESRKPHLITEKTTLNQCYATLPDGIGNQGIIVSRRMENGDISMMSVAINDLHGVIDCFGFYQLSEEDFLKIIEKFHEESCKIAVPYQYCLQRLTMAEALNKENNFRVPYEYTCWKVLLDDASLDEPVALMKLCEELANLDWVSESGNLYHHPDFTTWFLEKGDHDLVSDHLSRIIEICESTAKEKIRLKDFLEQMETLSDIFVRDLLSTSWREILMERLANASFLLHCQRTHTFSKLAATEVIHLRELKNPQNTDIVGFVQQYGRRCVEEELLRIKQLPDMPEFVVSCVDHVIKKWQI